MDKHAAQRSGLDEADACPARSGTTDPVDGRKALASHFGEHSIDIVNPEGQVVQAGPALGEVAGNRPLVLPGRTRARSVDKAPLRRIEVLQELKLAIADGDECNAQTAHRPRRAVRASFSMAWSGESARAKRV